MSFFTVLPFWHSLMFAGKAFLEACRAFERSLKEYPYQQTMRLIRPSRNIHPIFGLFVIYGLTFL
jgi:hypothetical protein